MFSEKSQDISFYIKREWKKIFIRYSACFFLAGFLIVSFVSFLVVNNFLVANAAGSPSISSITPNNGPVDGGTVVTIHGSNFQTSSIDKLSNSGQYSCGIVSGKAYCWGNNNKGQLGDGTTTTSSSPVAVDTSGVLSGKTVDDIATAAGHACALAEGHVYCWGEGDTSAHYDNWRENGHTPSEIYMSGVLSGKTITDLAMKSGHACVIADGKAYCWGWNFNGQLGNGNDSDTNTPVAVDTSGVLSGKTIVDISVGTSHTCAVDSNGKGYCWGQNNYGQLGIGSATHSSPVGQSDSIYTPRALDTSGGLGSKHIDKIFAMSNNSCALAGSNVYCWGNNDYGAIGDGTATLRVRPTSIDMSGVLSGKTITDLSAKSSTPCVIADGGVYCWGVNFNGGVGDGTSTHRHSPVAVDTSGALNGKTIKSISTSGATNCAFDDANSLYCWGSNMYGQFGVSTPSSSKVPVAIDMSSVEGSPMVYFGATPATSVSYVSQNELTVVSPVNPSGKVDIKVTNPDGKSDTKVDSFTYVDPTPPPSISYISPDNGDTSGGTYVTINGDNFIDKIYFSSVELGGGSSCGLTNTGALYCWGYNYFGQLGTGDTDNKLVPTQITAVGDKDISHISMGASSTCISTSDKETYCWGQNPHGILGVGNTDDAHTPQKVTGLSGKRVISLSVYSNHACASTSDSETYCWGWNNKGQLGLGNMDEKHTPTEVTALHGDTVTHISTGFSHTCASTSDSKTYCWGGDIWGQLGIGSNDDKDSPTEVTALDGKFVTHMSSGMYYTCASTSDSETYCWGWNVMGQLGTGDNNNRSSPAKVVSPLDGKSVSVLTAGMDATCAKTYDGKVYCWGNNNHGQLGIGNEDNKNTPVEVTALGGYSITDMSTSSSSNCAGLSDGSAYCWGDNTYGQLGNGTTDFDPHDSPVLVDTPASFSNNLRVLFDGVDATGVSYMNSNTINTITPPHSAGTVDVKVINPDGQYYVSNNAYTYKDPGASTVPDKPTNLEASPNSEDSVKLSWDAPINDGGSSITDYTIEYSDNGGSTWHVFGHPVSTTTSIVVGSLLSSTSYSFRVSAVNSVGTGSPSAIVTSKVLFLTVSSDSAVSLSITPLPNQDVISSNSSTVTVSTNNPNGYVVTISMDSANTSLTHDTEELSKSSGTQSSPSALDTNTWGYRIDGVGGFGALNTTKETNQASSSFTWAGVPAFSHGNTILSSPTSATNDTATIWFAVRANMDKPNGLYEGTVLYTVVVN